MSNIKNCHKYVDINMTNQGYGFGNRCALNFMSLEDKEKKYFEYKDSKAVFIFSYKANQDNKILTGWQPNLISRIKRASRKFHPLFYKIKYMKFKGLPEAHCPTCFELILDKEKIKFIKSCHYLDQKHGLENSLQYFGFDTKLSNLIE